MHLEHFKPMMYIPITDWEHDTGNGCCLFIQLLDFRNDLLDYWVTELSGCKHDLKMWKWYLKRKQSYYQGTR